MSELGARLQQARIEKGYNLEDLQELTKIQKRYLAGIENGDYFMLPGPFYTRAFIKQYAEAVGLDASQLLDEYKSEVPVPSNEEVSTQLAAPIPLSRQAFTRSSANRLGEMMPKIIVALFIIVILLILVFFYSQHASNEPLEEEVADRTGMRYEEPMDSRAALKQEEADEQ